MGEGQVRMMDASIVEAYAERVYGYAIKHTYSREEADDLSQEILFTVIKELPNLRDESRFEPWLWGIAHNVTRVFKRSIHVLYPNLSQDTKSCSPSIFQMMQTVDAAVCSEPCIHFLPSTHRKAAR